MEEGSLVELRVMARAMRRYEEHAAAATGWIFVCTFKESVAGPALDHDCRPYPRYPNFDNSCVRIPGWKIQDSNLQDPERFGSAAQ